MRCLVKVTLFVIFLATSIHLKAQQVWPIHQDPALLARLSYDSSPVTRRQGVSHVCIAISLSGDYRIVRSLDDKEAEWRQGKIPEGQFRRLKSLLESDQLRNITGYHGGLVVQDFESFGAEIAIPEWDGKTTTKRLQWLDAEGANPFPEAVSKVVTWLKRFEPAYATPFDRAEYPNVCPSERLRLLEPSIAGKLPQSSRPLLTFPPQ